MGVGEEEEWSMHPNFQLPRGLFKGPVSVLLTGSADRIWHTLKAFGPLRTQEGGLWQLQTTYSTTSRQQKKQEIISS